MIALVLTFLSVADLLLLQVRERQQEIGLLLAVGWRPGWIQRLFVQEGLILAMNGAPPFTFQWLAAGTCMPPEAPLQVMCGLWFSRR